MVEAMSIEQRVRAVQAQLADAVERAERAPGSVRLIAVSKRHPASAIRQAYALGLRDFGENYVQELVSKAEQLASLPDIRWHLIGHLQRNKARHVAKVAHVVHTLDNAVLAHELARRLDGDGRTVEAYIEVNVGNEAQKTGCAPNALPELLEAVRRLPAIELVGLMTVGRLVGTAEDARPTFVQLRQLRDTHAPDLKRLSMGMSNDFEVAIAEGATDVRVGTAIFGPRE